MKSQLLNAGIKSDQIRSCESLRGMVAAWEIFTISSCLKSGSGLVNVQVDANIKSALIKMKYMNGKLKSVFSKTNSSTSIHFDIILFLFSLLYMKTFVLFFFNFNFFFISKLLNDLCW